MEDPSPSIEDDTAGLPLDAHGFRQSTLLLAGICTASATVLSCLLIKKHASCWKNTPEQMRIVLIILMVPLYAIDSYIGLIDIKASDIVVTLLDAVKECYEAVVISAFLGLLCSYLGLSPNPKDPFLRIPDHLKGKELHHTFPVSLVSKSMRLEIQSVRTLSRWTSQFVLLRPLLSILIISLEYLELYFPPFTWAITLVLNVSVSVAIYALVLFYHAFAGDLAPHRPLAKFLCIKGVVFFTFWQGVALQGLAQLGLLHEGHWPYSVRQVEDALQNFLVCVQMLVFASCDWYAFGTEDYKQKLDPLKLGKKNK